MWRSLLVFGVLCLWGVSCTRRPKPSPKYDWNHPDTILNVLSKHANKYEGPTPVKLDLELSKTKLELEELAYLSVKMTNMLDRDQYIRIAPGVFDWEDRFFLFVMTPDKERGRYAIWCNIDYARGAKLYYELAANEMVQDGMILDFQRLIPSRLKDQTGRILPGNYKLFAIYSYRLTADEKLKNALVFSDTIEVTINTEKEEYDLVLSYLDSLRNENSLSSEVSEIYSRISETNTPYSEGAWAMYYALISHSVDYDSIVAAKARFDKMCPNSPFSEVILHYQLGAYLYSKKKYGVNRNELDYTADSLVKELRRLSPNSVYVLKFTNPDAFFSYEDLPKD